MSSKPVPDLVVTKGGVPFEDQAEGVRQFKAACERAAAQPTQLIARPIEEYHEDMGPVLWWRFPIEEPPYCGGPNDLGYSVEARMSLNKYDEQRSNTIHMMVGGWPGYHTHFTTFEVPVKPPVMLLGEWMAKVTFAYADNIHRGYKPTPGAVNALGRWLSNGGIKL